MATLTKATKIKLNDFKSVQMRTFHLSWIAFFLCFFGWFAHAPLMNATIGPDLNLTANQKLIAFIGSVGITILARLYIGSMCDKVGPRKSYVYLLIFGAFAVAASSFAYNWPTYLLSRMLIGVIGASFVITQYHTSVMFSPKIVGFANATTAGWGNLGGGVTQAVMPLIAAAMVAMGFAESELSKWRPAMFVPAAIMLFVAYLYWKYTQDSPEGNYEDRSEEEKTSKKKEGGSFLDAAKDVRVWILFAIYGGCFGMELFVNGKASTYYQTRFELSETVAGTVAMLFGLMNLFARSTGGWLGDKFSRTGGLKGRVTLLVVMMILEGISLIIFSRMGVLSVAIASMIVFSLFVQMAEGATFSVVPFINKKSLGAVTGIVGAGGNVGAVCYAQFMLQTGTALQDCFLYFGMVVCAVGVLGLGIKFSPEEERSAVEEQERLDRLSDEELEDEEEIAAVLKTV